MVIDIPTPLVLLEFQIEHYGELLANAKTIEARIHLRRELYNFKQQLKTLLN